MTQPHSFPNEWEKGGEWDHVFVISVTDGFLPFYRAQGDKRAMAEERNLLYVAVTRARKGVALSRSEQSCCEAGSSSRTSDASFFEPRVSKTLRGVTKRSARRTSF